MRRRNAVGDENLRILERRWRESGDQGDALRFLQAATRTRRLDALTPEEEAYVDRIRSGEGEPYAEDIHEIVQDLTGGFERFASWDEVYAELQVPALMAQREGLRNQINRVYDRFRGRSLDQHAEAEIRRLTAEMDRVTRPETIESSYCRAWAKEDLRYRRSEVISDFKAEHDVRLTPLQRERLLALWEDALVEACRQALLVDLRRVMSKIVEFVNDASGFDACESGYELRGLPPPARLDANRRPAVRAWREGFGPNDEAGVWFTLSRSFIRALSEAGFCAGVYARQAVGAHPEALCLRNVTGNDVVATARRWGDCIGNRLGLPNYTEDPVSYLVYPTDEQAMDAVFKKPSRKRRPRR